MSAQAGILNLDGGPADRSSLLRISQGIQQSRCNGEWDYVDGSLGMLYRPFHTTRESRLERQPHVSPRGSVITWDGRLDNRVELTRQLGEAAGERTDVEIVMSAFECWGTESFSRLIGDWALVLWDPGPKALILARDYAGIRHIFYHLTPRRATWCTSLAAIVVAGQSFSLCDEYIAGYLATYPEPYLTPYREVFAVPPGCHVQLRDGRTRTFRYWTFSPSHRIRYKRDEEYEEHFRHVFRGAVRRRLRANSPILAELSGGLDSSSIVCMADAILQQGDADTSRLDTLSFCDAKEPGENDQLYIAKVEEKRGQRGHHIERAQYQCDFGSTHDRFSPVPLCSTGGAALERDLTVLLQNHGYRVVLSGVGGDELLGGVPDPSPLLADLLLKLDVERLARELMAWSLAKRRPWIQLLSHAATIFMPASIRARLTKIGSVAPWIDHQFARWGKLSVRQLGQLDYSGVWLPSRRSFVQSFSGLVRQMAYAPPTLGGAEERRYPYLDQTLVEFLFSIPQSQLLRPGERRSLMRRALRGLLPPEVLVRRGKGRAARSFVVALANKRADVQRLFTAPLSSRLGYVHHSRFLDSLRSAANGDAPHLVRLLKTVALELWLQQLLERGVLAQFSGHGVPLDRSIPQRETHAVSSPRNSKWRPGCSVQQERR